MIGRRALPALALVILVAGGCGKETPKVDAAAEQKEALERSRQGALGTQVKALEAAKGMEADLSKKAQESIDKAEQATK